MIGKALAVYGASGIRMPQMRRYNQKFSMLIALAIPVGASQPRLYSTLDHAIPATLVVSFWSTINIEIGV